ncbi:MAG TPA: hypothetical protein VIO57_01355 [Chloroflexota bacterium]|jgi:hypothetical protein
MGSGRYLTNTSPTTAPGRPAEPVPEGFTATIDYEDDRGRRYKDSYDLTLKTFLNQTRSAPSNTDEPGMKRRLLEALETIARRVGRY